MKELAAKYGVRYLETSTELCHNIDELLVEMTSMVRAERQKQFRSQRRSSVRTVRSLILSPYMKYVLNYNPGHGETEESKLLDVLMHYRI